MISLNVVRLYERVITEHINSWYSELSHDEEFIQEIRHLFRDTTNEVLTRLTRVRLIILYNTCTYQHHNQGGYH